MIINNTVLNLVIDKFIYQQQRCRKENNTTLPQI